MKLQRRHIVTFLVEADEMVLAEQAESTLPEEIDMHDDADALRALGIDPGLLATQIANLEP